MIGFHFNFDWSMIPLLDFYYVHGFYVCFPFHSCNPHALPLNYIIICCLDLAPIKKANFIGDSFHMGMFAS